MPDATTHACALILLAAGASTRMGRPKQLLTVAGQPLLRRVAETALAAPVAPVIVVLGAGAATIAPCLAGLAVRTVINPRWPEGMGASLGCGIETLRQTAPAADAVIIALADHANLSARHLAALIAARQATGRGIAATEFRGVRLPPVCFDRRYFDALGKLPGDTGARHLLAAHPADVTAVPLATHPDLDTPEDYRAFTPPPAG
jgi:molybdenum cofactor cytidylyltransferase